MPLFRMIQSGEFDPARLLTWIIALTLGITIHEFAHAWRAEKAGDPTPRSRGRLSLNPLDHYDPVGTTLILLFGFGWGKPVPVNPAMFRNPRRDQLMVALWGPLSNLILAVVLAIPIRLGVTGVYTEPLMAIILLQLILAIFNLLPVYPLDGSRILSAMLPVDKARRLDALFQQYGMVLLIVVVMVAGQIIWPVVMGLLYLLVGV